MTLSEKLQHIWDTGPDRVIVDPDGCVYKPEEARRVYDRTSEIILIRQDDWTLGADETLAGVAFKLWEHEWIGFMVMDSSTLYPMSLFDQRNFLLDLVQTASCVAILKTVADSLRRAVEYYRTEYCLKQLGGVSDAFQMIIDHTDTVCRLIGQEEDD